MCFCGDIPPRFALRCAPRCDGKTSTKERRRAAGENKGPAAVAVVRCPGGRLRRRLLGVLRGEFFFFMYVLGVGGVGGVFGAIYKWVLLCVSCVVCCVRLCLCCVLFLCAVLFALLLTWYRFFVLCIYPKGHAAHPPTYIRIIRYSYVYTLNVSTTA